MKRSLVHSVIVSTVLVSTAVLVTMPINHYAHAINIGQSSVEVSKFSRWLPSTDIVTTEQRVNNRVSAGNRITIDFSDLNQTLLNTTKSVVISLPLPNGVLANFQLTPSITMAPELASRYPTIRTFTGFQIDNPKNRGNFDVTPHGFHGLFRLDDQHVYVEPQFQGNTENYISYYQKDALALNPQKVSKRLAPVKKLSPIKKLSLNRATHPTKHFRLATPSLRTYRIAVAADGEFTAFHGGTKALGLAAVVTMINRVNDVYQRDLAIKLELVADNDKLIFVDAATDPYANDDTDIDINTKVIDDAIGNDSYDIGHVVGTGGGGVAGFGVVCDSAYKGEGLTGSDQPTGDSFFIDFVAHEIGHQFKADHTFNGVADSCEGNRAPESSFEPGSGTTIMGYAGICGEQDLQQNSDAYFHTHSISDITKFVTSGVGNSCGKTSLLSNSAPVVNAGQDYVIPVNTPFELSGSATDSDNDSISYSWQQYDLGPLSNNVSEQIDDGKRPLFRVWNPVATPVRVFPMLNSILTNKTVIGETYPTTARMLNFRLLARDGKGGVSFDAMQVTVVETNEPFSVTSPEAGSQWNNAKQVVRWNVAGTNELPISCATVDLSLSLDGGKSFEHTLAKKVDNNGHYEVIFTTENSEKARIKVNCSNNVFFAINKGDFSLGVVDGPLKILGLKSQLTTQEDTAIALIPTLFNYQGGQATSIKILSGDNYQITDGKVLPNENFNGDLLIGVIGIKEGVESEKFIATLKVVAVNDNPIIGNDTATVITDSSQNIIDVLANDSDPDKNDVLTLMRFEYSGSSVLSVVDSKLVYSPAKGFVGSESIVYVVSDSKGASTKGNVVITVKATAIIVEPTTSTSNNKGGALHWLILVLLGGVIRQKRYHGRKV